MATSPKNTASPAKAAADTPTSDYEVISPLDHDGVAYAVGDTVALTDAQAAPLLGQAVRAK